MKTFLSMLNPHLLLAIAVAASAGCSTLQHRSVQDRFQDAVRADNERATMPFTEVTSQYQAVAKELTVDSIKRLDPKLRPNAWTLRAVSQWRSGSFAEALASASEGIAEINQLKPQSAQLENGRDSILLTLLPGLVEDSRLRERFNTGGAADVAAHYEDYAAKFRAALRALGEARGKTSSATPGEVIQYWNYQCWRVLANWAFILSQLPLDTQAGPYRDADAFVKTTLVAVKLGDTSSLLKAIESVKKVLPDQHPYRQLIELEERR